MTISNFFVPNRQIIENITQANPGVVTTTQDNGYHNGLFVRIQLPGSFGMSQLDDQVFQITVLTSDTFSIPVDTRNFDAFSLSTTTQSPQVIPVGEVASTLISAVVNNDNITPET